MQIKDEQKSQLFSVMPEVLEILTDSSDINVARTRLFNFCKDLEWAYREGEKPLHKLDYSIALEAIKIFTNLISLRNEKIAGFSTLQYLWELANDETESGISEGFLQEIRHLLLAMAGKADVARGWLGPILEKTESK